MKAYKVLRQTWVRSKRSGGAVEVLTSTNQWCVLEYVEGCTVKIPTSGGPLAVFSTLWDAVQFAGSLRPLVIHECYVRETFSPPGLPQIPVLWCKDAQGFRRTIFCWGLPPGTCVSDEVTLGPRALWPALWP